MKPLVGIIVGSDSDLPLIQETTNILEGLEIPYEVTIGSAHRTPERVTEFVSSAVERGIKVIIAAAGNAAHLPGVIASKTILPVIGIPVDSGPLNGVDALYSIVQMPAGIPVASMAIGKAGARNAGIFAAQILATTNEKIAQKLIEYRQKMAETVIEKAKELEKLGITEYIKKSK
ncbi:MAG: 5-(carboxyamino)imidazole ribonucleotide mutase [Candidatus Poribacteria bacterium]